MEILKTAVLLAIFTAITSEAASNIKANVLTSLAPQKYKEYLVGDKALLCLDSSCVGYAGNEKGFLKFMKDAQFKEFTNLPDGKTVANDNIACFSGACIGIKDKKPFMGYLLVNQSMKADDIINLKNDNAFLCLNGACVHMVGHMQDTLHALKNLQNQGVDVKMAQKVEMCTNNGCENMVH